ncbi:hypothetical protein ACPPVO_17045 [Dactylosporangium sp. McL0621]|uniref:hypothetical protein n=1 Tax=Dactylosporangium sp. McL0621 TaxID=3415678 RepID=UPI003CEE8FEB
MKHITAALVGALALASLAGCETSISTGTTGTAKAVNNAAAVPPQEALTKAVKTLDTTAYNVALRQGVMTGGGRVDPAAGKAVLTIGGDVDLGLGDGKTHLSVGYTILAPELYIKADFGDTINEHYGMDPAAWMHVDRSKITGSQIPLTAAGRMDVGIVELLSNTAGVKRADKTHYTGTIDVTTVKGIMAPTSAAAKKEGAKTLPFTATVDAQNRLTVFTIDGASVDENLAMEVTFTGYGSIDPVTAPAGAIECPEPVYQLIG